MKRCKLIKGLCVFAMLSFTQICVAQYSFSVTLHGDGSKHCQQAAAQAQSILSRYGSLASFPTRAACESTRSNVLSIKANGYGCNIYYTATPCTGTDMSSMGNTSSSIPGTPPVGNPALEINGQVEDYNYMREVQDPVSSVDYILTGGDGAFMSQFNKALNEASSTGEKDELSLKIRHLISDPINGASATAAKLMSKDPLAMSDVELYNYFSDEYERLTGMDIDQLLNKMDLTLEEQAVVDNYNLFVDTVLDKLQPHLLAEVDEEYQTPLEYSVYALDAYGDEDLSEFNIPKPLTDVSSIPEANQLKIQEILDMLNGYNNKLSGFHADLYYDATKDNYVISFRGTQLTRPNDLWADAKFAILGVSTQHDNSTGLAAAIENSGIPKDKWVITGHSLGGGLALLAGLKTGCKTYAYNPQHIPKEAIVTYNLDVSPQAQSKIQVYTARGENVVGIAEGLAHGLKNTADVYANTSAMSNGAVFMKNPVSPSLKSKKDSYLEIGSQHTVETMEGLAKHSQVDMVKGLSSQYGYHKDKVQGKISRLRASDSFLHRQKSSLFRISDSDKEYFAPNNVPIKIVSRK